MNVELDSIIDDIRIDLDTDFIAMNIVDLDGMSVAGAKAVDEFDSDVASAHFTMVMKLAQKISENMDIGAVRENLVSTESFFIFSRYLGDGSLYWLLATSKGTTLGIVRTLMDEYEQRIWGALHISD